MKKYLIAGLLVWLPLAVTIWVLQAVLGMLNGMFVWLLAVSQVILPEGSHAFIAMLQKIPFLGVFVMVIGLLLTGIFATNVAGQWSLRQGHRLLKRIPIVKSIYSSVQQVSDTLFSSSGNAFREAVLVAVPARRLLDDRLRHRQAGRRGGAAPARRLPQRLRADDAEPDLGLFPDAAAQRRHRAVDERRRGAQVRDLDGRRRPADAHRSGRGGGAKSAGLSARPALSPPLRPTQPKRLRSAASRGTGAPTRMHGVM